MSIQAVGWVLDTSKAEGSERLVLLSLANHAHSDGTDAYPSVATIARESRMSERSVQRALGSLKESGHIVATGRAPDERIAPNRRPTNYRIVGVPTVSPQADQGCQTSRSGVTDPAFRGDKGVTQTVLNQEQTADESLTRCEQCNDSRWIIDFEAPRNAPAIPCPCTRETAGVS